MGDASIRRQAAPGALDELSDSLCARFRVDRPDARVLRIRHPSPDATRTAAGGEGDRAPGLHIQLTLGRVGARDPGGPGLQCDTRELPFSDGVFRCVTLYHVISAGDEPELKEACRVLAPGGNLLLVGLNHCGWAGFDAGNWAGVPRMRPSRVRQRLRALDMAVERQLGAGLLGRHGPGVIDLGWQRIVLPLADVVLLHARHQSRPALLRPKLKDVRAGVASTAIAGR